jgi:hypothetical protein
MRKPKRWIAVLFAASLAACAHSSPPPSGAAVIERWADNHPEASHELGEWVQHHPAAARLFFEWDAEHPARSKEFVTWAINHPAKPLEAFTATHPGWAVFDTITETHRPAAEAFMGWCRRHPRAAEALMHHSRGLEWAGHHLYAASWEMEAK